MEHFSAYDKRVYHVARHIALLRARAARSCNISRHCSAAKGHMGGFPPFTEYLH